MIRVTKRRAACGSTASNDCPVRQTFCVEFITRPSGSITMDNFYCVASSQKAVEDFLRFSFGLWLDSPDEMADDEANQFFLGQSCIVLENVRPVVAIYFRPTAKGESKFPVARIVDINSGAICEMTFEQYEQSGRKVPVLSH